MPYVYRHFIPQNTAPVGAKSIGVYDNNGNKVCSIPLGRLTPPNSTKLYSFCALSDIHLTYDTANADFQRALTYAESNCDFTCICGDLVSTGAESEMQTYKSIVDTYAPTKPVYAISGNHENYSTKSQNYLQTYTGQPLYYSFTQGNDVFIMLGHYGGYGGDGIGWKSSEFLSADEIQWLYETLETNRNKRCFVFQHCLPHKHGVGNPNGLYTSALILNNTDGGIGQAFISLLKHYKNTIFFHGHSHTMFWLQEKDKKANYSSADGYRSIHIPSLAVPRDLAESGTSLENVYAESEGYIVDVYDNCIVLNGRDFIDNDADGHILPIATYKIDTTLQNIEANTFTDSMGIITT
jgi:predicted phosphodiesterase